MVTLIPNMTTKTIVSDKGNKYIVPVVSSEEMEQIMRKEEKKLAVMVKKQEKVLFVAFHLLLNLAEDLQIERKMRNRQIIGLLLSMLDRNNPDLLFIVLNFLKKLSIFGDNKTEMKEQGVVEKLNRFIPCNNQLLL